jgi:Cu/Ag efflux protein CusF
MYVARRRGPSLVGCAVITLLTLVIAVLAVGWWRNWYDVATRDTPEELEFGVRIHKDEVERDFGKLRDETQRVAETAKVAADLETMEGTVVEVSPTQITVQVAEQDHTLRIDDVTKVFVEDEEASLESLQAGDPVRVTYEQTDGHKRASRITVLQREGN